MSVNWKELLGGNGLKFYFIFLFSSLCFSLVKEGCVCYFSVLIQRQCDDGLNHFKTWGFLTSDPFVSQRSLSANLLFSDSGRAQDVPMFRVPRVFCVGEEGGL